MKKYRNKKTKMVGVVVSQDITTTLKFSDGAKLILTPASLRNHWELVDDGHDHLTFIELCNHMRVWNTTHNVNEAEKFAVIVYSQSNFSTEYSEESRSYRVSNANDRFSNRISSDALLGDCLDGSEDEVRLDWYDWQIEYCYFE